MSRLLLCCLIVCCGGVWHSASAQEAGTALPETMAGDTIPAFHLTQVDLSGEVLADRAALKATIDVTVNHGAGWHDVPLRLGQAHVWRRSYTGEGDEAPGTAVAAEDGLVWKVRGIGRHQLTFDLWVPIKRIPGGGQLQLSLPALPPQFETSLSLQIPQGPVSLRVPKETTTLLGQQDLDGSTAVQASIAGARLDIAWHPAASPRGSFSQVRSNWSLNSEPERLSVVVDQTLQFEPGQISEVRVKTPPDFTVQEVTGLFVESWKSDPARPGWVLVELNPGTADKAELRWLLERASVATGSTLQLDGMDVEGSVRQSGLIRIERQPEMRLLADLNRSRFVQRTEGALPRAASEASVLTYEYSRQPFRLQMLSASVTTVTTVTPGYELDFQEREVRLTCDFDVNVEAGTVRELSINLPAAASGWQDLEFSEGNQVLVPTRSTPENVWKFTWDSPRSGQIKLSGTAVRPLAGAISDPWQLKLPKLLATHSMPARVLVTSADQLEVSFATPQGDSPLTPIDTALEPVGSSGRLYRLADAGTSLPVKLQVHPRELEARSLLEVNGDDEQSVQVTQHITLNVRYGRVSSVGLLIPDELTQLNPTFALTEAVQVYYLGVRLNPVPSPSGMRVSLPTSLPGEVSLELRYRYPLPKAATDRQQAIQVPVISLEETPFTEMQCHVAQIDQIQVREGDDWGAVTTSPTGALWVARDPATQSVPVTVSSDLAQAAQQYVVDRASLWTRFESNGLAQTIAIYQLNAPPGRIVLRLPADTTRDTLRDVRINGEVVMPSQLELVEAERPELRLTLDPAQSGPLILGLMYRSPATQSFGLFHIPEVEFPTFPKSVWVNETNWEFVLPMGQHLFIYPETLEPRFTWQRFGLIWRRVLTPDYLAVRDEWWGQDRYQQGGELGYAFHAFGPVPNAKIRTMSQSLILLVGAGTSLLLGFMFWRFPFTRNLLTLMTLAFAVSIASMWYLESIQLLLQPAIIGLVLAGLATLIDSRFRKSSPVVSSSQLRGSSIMVPPAVGLSGANPPGSESATKVPSTIYRPGA